MSRPKAHISETMDLKFELTWARREPLPCTSPGGSPVAHLRAHAQMCPPPGAFPWARHRARACQAPLASSGGSLGAHAGGAGTPRPSSWAGPGSSSPPCRPAVSLHTRLQPLTSHPFPCPPFGGQPDHPPCARPRARLRAWVPELARRRLLGPWLVAGIPPSCPCLRKWGSQRAKGVGMKRLASVPQPPGSSLCSPN